jgi:hypothetical protein
VAVNSLWWLMLMEEEEGLADRELRAFKYLEQLKVY